MPSKRRNNGRTKKNKGHSSVVNCINCGRIFPKDKAVKRFQMRKLLDESSRKDIQDASAYGKEVFNLPKLYIKMNYCVSCAIHARVVRVRSQVRGDRDIRYTTKLRKTNIESARTGGFAIPAPSLVRAPRPQQKKPEAA